MERYDEFRAAYEQARAELIRIPSVIGVGHGPKRKGDQLTGDYAIIAYVDQKLPLDQLPDSERVPSTYQGWLTDVSVPDAEEREGAGGVHVEHDEDEHDLHHHSHDGMFLDWAKLHAVHAQQMVGASAEPAPALVPGYEHVALIADDGRLLMPNGRVDFVGAFKRFKVYYGDCYDFVSFFVDTQGGMPNQNTFHSGIYNQTRGVNYYAGNRLDARGGWGTQKLQAFHCFSFISMGALLQEMGHMWGGYVTVKYRADDPDCHFDLLIGDDTHDINQVAHWGRGFNDDNSPMDYDGVKWSDNRNGTFTLRPVGDDEHEFCDLDLYLMGLLPPDQVRPFYVVRDSTQEGESLFAAQRLDLGVQNVIWAHGARVPATGQTRFRQAFVVLTKDASAAATFVAEVDRWRQAYEQAFARATRGKASVDTTLSPAPL
ncbi:MAG: hypothetical protein LC737_01310, partial [Chloroflexi bacterium]|nr:hypothetical protein [Chloroflexota bacterium]